MDEINIQRTPRLILTNIGEQTIYDLYPSRKQEKVKTYLSKILDKESIELVTMDMWEPYKNAVTVILPQAKIVIDKFHVGKMANKAVDDYRKSLSGELSTGDRRKMMRSRFILLKRKEKLTAQEQFTLSNWSNEFAMLGVAHEVKEAFYGIYDARDRFEAQRRYWDWQLSIPKELEPFFHELTRAIKNWENEIFNYFDNRITNAFTESLNSIVRKIEAAGRGYSFAAVRTKILYTLGLKRKEKPRFDRRFDPNMDTLDMINPWAM